MNVVARTDGKTAWGRERGRKDRRQVCIFISSRALSMIGLVALVRRVRMIRMMTQGGQGRLASPIFRIFKPERHNHAIVQLRESKAGRETDTRETGTCVCCHVFTAQ